jgi:alanyl-tRNA synthetase
MVRPAYERDAYLRVLDTEVVEAGVAGEQPYAVTADTLFYPEGGGQPADRGTMAGVEVVDVRKTEDGSIRHFVAERISEGPVRQELDWSRRYDHMQQHTAQHVITATALARLGWATTAFHLGPDLSDIELDVADLRRADLDRLEEEVMEVIRAGRAVSIRYAARDQMEELGVRSRLLPQDFEGDELRLVEVDGVDLNTCGGTHVRSTSEVGVVSLIGTESMRGGTRVFFLAGDRVRRRLAGHELRNARLREILDTADEDMPEIVQHRLEHEKRLARERRRLAEELAEAVAVAMAAEPGHVAVRHWEDRDMDFLQKLGRGLLAIAPSRVALLTSGQGSEGVFVIAAGDEAPVDLGVVGPEIAELLEGRGGGSHGIFQGKAAKLSERKRAAELLAERCTG